MREDNTMIMDNLGPAPMVAIVGMFVYISYFMN